MTECYECSKLAELIAENGKLHANVGNLKDRVYELERERGKLLLQHREDTDAVANITREYWLLRGKLTDKEGNAS